jgi:hypothetical protein
MNATPTIRRRVVPLAALLAVAALLVALVTAAVSQARADAAEPTSNGQGHVQGHRHGDLRSPHTKRQVAFHDEMRKLWEDHVTWTRLAIVTFADKSASFDATAARLLRNQTDIGDAIKPFYGEAAGAALTGLLHEHITIAVELLQAAKAGDMSAFDAAKTRWYANANDIADFLASANPRFLSRTEMRAAMKAHLDQTLAEAAHELGGDYAASVADYEEIHLHILGMADRLSSGIMRQFPGKFH